MSKYNIYPKPINGGMLSSQNSTLEFPDFSNVTVTGGTIDGTTIGENFPSSGTFTDLVVTVGPSTITGNTTVIGDLVVTGNISGGSTGGFTIEHLTTSIGSFVNPSNIINVSFMKFTPGVGTISTGTLSIPDVDGFYKIIVITGIPSGSEYILTINRLLDPGTATTGNKTIKFKYSGQGQNLIYSEPDNCYAFVPGGSV
jgi:hypothetical protein